MALIDAVSIQRVRPASPFARAVSLNRPRGRAGREARAMHNEGVSLPGGMDDCERPLRPLSVPEHVARYRSVDNFCAQFKEFKAAFADAANVKAKGHLFVVTGDRGYGKTSLRQRCAFWMRVEYAPSHLDCEIVVVDLSDEDWKNDTSNMRIVRVRDWILDEMSGWLDPEDITRIRNFTDMFASFKALGTALRTRGAETGDPKPIVLVVLLPGYPSVVELEEYYRLAREGMVLLAEVLDVDATREITDKIDKSHENFRRDSIDAHVLPLGELKPGDDELLMARIQADLANCPAFSNGEVLASFKGLIQTRKVGVSQLMKLLIGVLENAMAEQANVVTVDHIIRYYNSLNYEPRD